MAKLLFINEQLVKNEDLTSLVEVAHDYMIYFVDGDVRSAVKVVEIDVPVEDHE